MEASPACPALAEGLAFVPTMLAAHHRQQHLWALKSITLLGVYHALATHCFAWGHTCLARPCPGGLSKAAARVQTLDPDTAASYPSAQAPCHWVLWAKPGFQGACLTASSQSRCQVQASLCSKCTFVLVLTADLLTSKFVRLVGAFSWGIHHVTVQGFDCTIQGHEAYGIAYFTDAS